VSIRAFPLRVIRTTNYSRRKNVGIGESGRAGIEAPEESFGGENVPGDLRIFARYIYGSQVKLKRLEIVSNQSYEKGFL